MRKPYICVAKQGIQQIIRTAGENFFHSNSYYVNQKSLERPDREIGSLHFLRRPVRWSQKRRDKMDRTRAKNFSTPIIYYIYIHIYFLLNNYCPMWSCVYKVLRIRRLGRDKTAVKNWAQSRVILECSQNPFFAFFLKSSFFGTGFRFSISNRTQKNSRSRVEKSAPRVQKGLLKMICDGLINTYSGIRHKCIPHTLRDAWCLSACEKPHIRTRIFDCAPRIPYSPLFVSCNICSPIGRMGRSSARIAVAGYPSK